MEEDVIEKLCGLFDKILPICEPGVLIETGPHVQVFRKLH